MTDFMIYALVAPVIVTAILIVDGLWLGDH